MQSIKELKAAIAELKADKGKSVMFNGELAGVKELQGVVKQLQSDIKALKANTTATDGISKGAQDATEKFRTLKQAVNDAVLAMDKAHQSSSGTAKYDGQTMNITQLTEAHSKALANLASMESSLAGNREKALQYEQTTRAAIDAEKLADEQRYQSYLQKNIRHEDKEYNSGDRRATMANLLDNRSQNKAYNAYYGDMAKSINAELNATDKVMDAYKASQIKTQNDIAEAKARINVAANAKYYTDQAKQSQENSDNIRKQMETRVKLENDTTNLIGKQNANASRQYWKDQETLIKQRSSQMQGWLQGQAKVDNPKESKQETINSTQYTDGIKQVKQNILAIDRQIFEQLQKNNGAETQRTAELRRQKSELESQLKALKTPKIETTPVPQSYAQQISSLQSQARQAHAEFRAGTKTLQEYNAEYLRLNVKATGLGNWTRESNDEISKMGKGFTGLNSNMEYFFAKFRSHVAWIITGGAIGAMVAMPTQMISRISEMEVGMAGVRQVLPDIEHDQAKVNEEAQKFINIAAQYGESVDKIIDAGRSWGRMYKDIAVVNLLVAQSAKMATADNFSLAESVKGIESAMAQFGMRSEEFQQVQINSNRIIDVITKVAHTGAASAQDLSGAIERAGSSAHQAGVSFEFFNALVATGVRNTARSGAEIGQSLKSMFSSIHSDKAMAEIEKLGISVYKFNEDGTRSFRDVQDVILDLSFAIQNTTKDTSALELALGGGKWQVSKITAIMTDYHEIIRMWEMSVNASGFANEQVGIQMETLSRKTQTLKAELDRVFNVTGNNGLATSLKGATESMTNFVIGVNGASEGLLWFLKWSAVAGVGIYTLATALQGQAYWSAYTGTVTKLANGATIEGIQADYLASTAKWNLVNAYKEQTAAAGMAAAASGKVSRGTAALTAISMGWVGIALLTAGTMYTVISAYGEHTKEMQKNADTIENRNAKAIDSLKADQQKSEFITTLSKKYNDLGVSIVANSEDTDGNTKKIEQQNIILEALARQTGLTTDEIVKDGVIQTETIDAIMKARRDESKEKIRQDIAKTLSDYNATQDFITQTNARIDAMKAEIKDVGLLGQALQWLNSVRANANLSEADRLDAQANALDANGDSSGSLGIGINEGNYMDGNAGDKRALAGSLRSLGNSQLQRSGEAGIDVLLGQVVNATSKGQAMLTGLQGMQASLDALDQKDEKPKIVDDSEGKNKDKSNGQTPPTDPSKKLARDAYNDILVQTMHRAKLATDAYSASIDTLNTKEETYGKTALTTSERFDTMQKRWQALNDQEWLGNNIAETLNKTLDSKVTNDLIPGVSVEAWRAMSKAQKAELRVVYKDILETHVDIKELVATIDKAEEFASKAGLDKTKIGNDMSKMVTPLSPEKQYKVNLERNATTQDLLIARSTNKYDPNNEVTLTAIKLKKLNEDKKLYDAEQQRLDKEVHDYEVSLKADIPEKEKEYLRKSLEIAKDAANQQRLISANNANAIADLEYQKNSKIRDGLYGITQDVLIQGNSLKNVWKNLWTSLANDALKQLFRVQNSSGGLLSSVLGIFGGSSPSSGAGISGKGLVPNADGGLYDKPTAALIGETGEQETVINLAKLSKGDQRQKGLLGYANSKLGIPKGTNVTASVSQRTMETANAIAQNSAVSREHISELQRSNALMSQQLTVLMHIAQQGMSKSSTGSSVVVMPTTQSDDALASQLASMKRNGYNVS